MDAFITSGNSQVELVLIPGNKLVRIYLLQQSNVEGICRPALLLQGERSANLMAISHSLKPIYGLPL